MSLSLTDPQGRRFRIVHGWGTGPCKSKNLYRSHPEAEAFVERLSSEQLSEIVRCFFGGSDHRPRHLRETPVNQTATCRQPVPSKAHTAADRIAAAICNAHLVVKPDTRLQPVDDPRSKLRMEIRQTLSAILLAERQEAARHQALLDQESAINKGLIYTGAAMTGLGNAAWGLLCWAKEVSDLVNPAVRLQHRFTALTIAAAADSDKLQVFADTLKREEWREVVEVIGFDPSKITDEHMAQAMDALDLVMADASLRQSLTTFSWDYIKAQHAIELTNAGGAAVFEIALTAILAALTGGVGAVASVASKARHVTKFKKLGELLVDFAKASKKLAAHAKARAKQAAQTVAKNFDDLKTDLPAVDRKGERPKGIAKNNRMFKAGITEADILAIDKPNRPAPSKYLTDEYQAAHLNRFKEEGGGFLFTSDDIANPKYKSFNPNKFVMAQKDLDAVLLKYSESGDIRVLENALGYEPGSLQGKKIYMMHIDNPKVNMPSGNEGGANSLWRPGGLTHPGGQAEAVLDNIPIRHNNDISNLTSKFDVTEI